MVDFAGMMPARMEGYDPQKYIDVISEYTNDIKRIKLPVKDFTEYYLKYNNA